MELKYGSLWGGWCTKEIRGVDGVGLWKGIRRGWERFCPLISFSVGNGERVKFWYDQWCGDSPLKGAFPALFSIAADKEAAVADLMSIRNGKIHWEVTFVRNLQDWEIDALVSFLDLLYAVSLHDSRVDQLCWQRNSKKGFALRSYYRCLIAPTTMKFPWKGIWKTKGPPPPPPPPPALFFFFAAVFGGNLFK